eukprot:EG_transcript_13557
MASVEWEAAHGRFLQEQGPAMRKSIIQSLRPLLPAGQPEEDARAMADGLLTRAAECALRQCTASPPTAAGAAADFKRALFQCIKQDVGVAKLQLLFNQKMEFFVSHEAGLEAMSVPGSGASAAPDTVAKAVLKFVREWKSKPGSLQEKLAKYSAPDLQKLIQKLTAMESKYQAWAATQPSPESRGSPATPAEQLLATARKRQREDPEAFHRRLRDICRVLAQDAAEDYTQPLGGGPAAPSAPPINAQATPIHPQATAVTSSTAATTSPQPSLPTVPLGAPLPQPLPLFPGGLPPGGAQFLPLPPQGPPNFPGRPASPSPTDFGLPFLLPPMPSSLPPTMAMPGMGFGVNAAFPPGAPLGMFNPALPLPQPSMSEGQFNMTLPFLFPPGRGPT